MTKSTDWDWKDLPDVPGMVPCLTPPYGGSFSYEDQVEIDKSLEMYDCPTGSSRSVLEMLVECSSYIKLKILGQGFNSIVTCI